MDQSSKRTQQRIIWAILIAAAILRATAAMILGDQVVILPGIFDQISYHALATRVLGGHGFTFESQWWPVTAAGQPTAHWSYLYTLYLVAVYAIFGVHPLASRLIQAILVGIITPWLTYRLARKAFPEGPSLQIGSMVIDVPLLAMAWTTCYGYFIYYSAALMTEAFYIASILWTLDCAIRIGKEETRTLGWLELGIAAGTTILLRQVFLGFLPFLLGWLFFALRYREQPSTIPFGRTLLNWLKLATLVVLVLAGMIAPFTWLNYQNFGRFVLLNTNAGYAFFWANHPIHGDSFVSLFTEEMPSYQELIPEELRGLDEAALDQELMRLGIGFVLQDPLRYLKLSISRIRDHFIFWPLPTSPLISNITRVGSLGIALPFMLGGMVTWLAQSIRRAKRKLGVWIGTPGTLLFLFISVYVGIHLLSWAGIRYRLPADAVLLIFAAYGLLEIYYFIHQKMSKGF